MDLRSAYLATAGAAVELLGRGIVGERWDQPSALAELKVSGLAGHLARAVLQVEWVLDRPEPDGEPIGAVQYYGELDGVDDLHSDLNAGVRDRGEETAAGGWGRLYLDTSGALDRLAGRLPTVPEGRLVLAFGRSLTIDEYLKTRLIELTVHLDDLAASLDVEPPELPLEATGVAIAVLVGVGRARVGDVAVLRSLARRERDTTDALRIL